MSDCDGGIPVKQEFCHRLADNVAAADNHRLLAGNLFRANQQTGELMLDNNDLERERGITILAKTSKALERLTEMFRKGEVHKTYWALCCPKPEKAGLPVCRALF